MAIAGSAMQVRNDESERNVVSVLRCHRRAPWMSISDILFLLTSAITNTLVTTITAARKQSLRDYLAHSINSSVSEPLSVDLNRTLMRILPEVKGVRVSDM